MIQTDIRDYQVTLVPENNETEVALILLHLQSTFQEYYEDQPGLWTSFPQFLWLLNVMRTINEGLARVDEDKTWEPEPAFEQFHDRLVIEYSEHATNEVSDIVNEFRDIIETLDHKQVVDEEEVLVMLYSLTNTMKLDQLSEFLVAEIDRQKAMRHN